MTDNTHLENTNLTTGEEIPLFDLTKKADRFAAFKYWLKFDKQAMTDHLSLLDSIDVNEQNEHGDTILHVAIRENGWHIVDKLLELGANPRQANNHGHLPVWLARRKNEQHLPENFRLEVMKAKEDGLLDATGAPKVKSENNQIKNMRNSKPLKKVEQQVNGKMDEKVQLWTEAFNNNDTKQMNCLLVDGLELKNFNNAGETPLHHAIANNNWEVVDRLVSFGAKILTLNAVGKSSLDYLESKWESQEPTLDIDHYEAIKDMVKDEFKPIHPVSNKKPQMHNPGKHKKHFPKKHVGKNLHQFNQRSSSLDKPLMEVGEFANDKPVAKKVPDVVIKKVRRIPN